MGASTLPSDQLTSDPPNLIPPKSLENNSFSPSTPSTSSVISRNDSAASELDLNDEVSKLAEKLINSMNHQSNLDESLQLARYELEQARKQIEILTAESDSHAKQIQDGSLLTKIESESRQKTLETELLAKADKISKKLTADLEAERQLRIKAETDKQKLEGEVETLTSALFEEANTMVANERKEREISDKKAEFQQAKVKDLEVLLEVQQAQLHDLKVVMEKMASEHAEKAEKVEKTEKVDNESHSSSQPPLSPISATNRSSKILDLTQSISENPNEHTPEPPLHYTYLLQPIFRTDVRGYEDFVTVIKAARAASPPPSRVASGSYGSIGGAVANFGSSVPAIGQIVATSSNTSLPRATSPIVSTITLPSLRDSKMFKRALVEDIEPTLRLDIAPGVSWMQRRYVIAAMVDGSLVVEPMPAPATKFRGPVNACSLCGENRVTEEYTRKHRFRISEDKEKKPFPLCDLCLGRLRSVGDLLSFMRMVSNGHWRADSDEEILSAWEELVRLKECMFWHRMSAGVVPANNKTPLPLIKQHSRTASKESLGKYE